MESLSLRVWHPSPWHSVIQGEGGGVYRKEGLGGDMSQGNKKRRTGRHDQRCPVQVTFLFWEIFPRRGIPNSRGENAQQFC